MIRYLLFSSALILASATAGLAEPAAWQIDPRHSSANFTVRHMMISNVRGSFNKVTGTVLYDGHDVSTAKVDAAIAVDSIDTREPKRDEHLKNADFFDVLKFPVMTFKSRRSEPVTAGRFQLVGDLSMHGVTREVVLEVEGPSPEIKDPQGNSRIGASATTRLNRKDFGLTWSGLLETGGAMVGDEVRVDIELELIKGAEPRQASRP